MKVLALLFLVGLSAANLDVPDTMLDFVKDKVFSEDCWGEEIIALRKKEGKAAIETCSKQPPILTLADLFDHEEPKPAAALGNATAEEVAKFLAELAELRAEKVTKMSNLTCVMLQLNKWTKDGKINIDLYTKTFWEKPEAKTIEESLKEAFIKVNNDCYTIANAIPYAEIATDKFTKTFGQRLKFHSCQKSKTDKLCAKRVMAEWLEEKHGAYTDAIAEALSLPKDKYDAGLIATAAKVHGKSKEATFIVDFFHTGKLTMK